MYWRIKQTKIVQWWNAGEAKIRFVTNTKPFSWVISSELLKLHFCNIGKSQRPNTEKIQPLTEHWSGSLMFGGKSKRLPFRTSGVPFNEWAPFMLIRGGQTIWLFVSFYKVEIVISRGKKKHTTGGPPLTRKSLTRFPLTRFLAYVRVSGGISIKDHPFKTSACSRGGGVKNLPNLPTDSTKKLPTVGG